MLQFVPSSSFVFLLQIFILEIFTSNKGCAVALESFFLSKISVQHCYPLLTSFPSIPSSALTSFFKNYRYQNAQFLSQTSEKSGRKSDGSLGLSLFSPSHSILYFYSPLLVVISRSVPLLTSCSMLHSLPCYTLLFVLQTEVHIILMFLSGWS